MNSLIKTSFLCIEKKSKWPLEKKKKLAVRIGAAAPLMHSQSPDTVCLSVIFNFSLTIQEKIPLSH